MHGTSNNVTIAGLDGSTSFNGILGSSINGTYTSISNVTLDSYELNIADSTTATASGDVGGSSVTATQNRLYDVSMLNIQTMTVPETNVSYGMRTTTGRSIHGTETEFSLAAVSNKISVIANDNTTGIQMSFGIAMGSSYTSGTLATTWAADASANAFVGQVNNADSTSNNWEITGVQLEIGEYSSSSIPNFEHESFGDNLARCQRYFQVIGEGSEKPLGNGHYWEDSEVFLQKDLNTTMRAEPTGVIVTGTNYYRLFRDGGTDDLNTFTVNSSSSKETLTLYASSSHGVTSNTKNRPVFLRGMNSSSKISADAEL